MRNQLIAFLAASHATRGHAFVALKGRILCSARGLSSSTGAAAATESAASELLPPSSVLDRVFETDKRPVILFDGVCNLCNNAVNLALDWDPKGSLRFSGEIEGGCPPTRRLD